MRLAEAAQEADGGRRSIEVGQLVLVDRLPESRRGGVDGRGFEDGCSDPVGERTIDEVTVMSWLVKLDILFRGSPLTYDQ